MHRIAAFLVIVLFAALGTGCNSYNINVSLQPELRDSLKDAQVEVHVLGVSSVDRSQLEATPVSAYWGETGNKVLWQDMEYPRKIVTLSAAQPSVVIRNDDPIWKGLGKNDWIFILTSYPRGSQEGVGNADARRRILPADKDQVGGDTVSVTITQGGLEFRK